MRSTHRLQLLLSAGIAGLLLTALPLGFDGATFTPVAPQAWAAPGNGNGNGNGHGNGNANGHDKADKNGKNQGDKAKGLGALNAAHASETALAHANPNSRVGKIAAYKEAALAAQAAAAAAASADQAIADAQAALDAALAAMAEAEAADGDHRPSPGTTRVVAEAAGMSLSLGAGPTRAPWCKCVHCPAPSGEGMRRCSRWRDGRTWFGTWDGSSADRRALGIARSVCGT